MRPITQAIRRAIRARFCPYVVADGYGTFQPVWSRDEALEWLPACGPVAAVIQRKTGRTLAARTMEPK